VHQSPGQHGRRQQQPPRPDLPLHQHPERGQRQQRQQQRADVQRRGVEDGDDDDRQQVVHHGEGEQEGAQRVGQVRVDHREHGERERDVGRGGDRPPPQAVAAGVDRGEEGRRDHDAARRRGDRQHRAPRIAQVTGHELALELQPGDEEEHREQPVRGPAGQTQIEVQRGRPDPPCGQLPVRVAPRRVGPDQRQDRRPQQQEAADRLGAQDVGDPAHLEPGATAEEAGGRRRGHGTSAGIGEDLADQASRRTAHDTIRPDAVPAMLLCAPITSGMTVAAARRSGPRAGPSSRPSEARQRASICTQSRSPA
jgi:hypothetical protein